MSEQVQPPKSSGGIVGSVVLLVPELRITGGEAGIGVTVRVSGEKQRLKAAASAPHASPAR